MKVDLNNAIRTKARLQIYLRHYNELAVTNLLKTPSYIKYNARVRRSVSESANQILQLTVQLAAYDVLLNTRKLS